MGKTSKATRKFQKKHLKHTIEHRREVKKENRKYELRRGNKKKSEESTEPKEKKSTKPVFDDMSIDEFFEGGFEVPKAKKGTKAAEHESGLEDFGEGSQDGLEEVSDEEAGEDFEGVSDKDDMSDEDQDDMSDEDQDEESSSEEEDEDMMKQDMQSLAEKDPEFYKYLEKNDKGLLDFEGVNPLDAMSDADESDEEKPVNKQTEITRALVSEWERTLAEKPDLKTIREAVKAFTSAVDINSSEENNTDYRLTDASVFTSLMFVGLQQIPKAVQVLCPYKKNEQEKRSISLKNPNAAKIAHILDSQGKTYLTILHDINNTETAALVLSSILEVLPFYLKQKKFLKKLVSAVAEIWSTTTTTDIQVATFAFLNNAAREFPDEILELVLRESYSMFLKNCRTTNVHTMDSINFSKNSASELFGIDEQLSYAVGFEFVRQLAIHLRETITSTTSSSASSSKDNHKKIYNWQFCHALDFWSRVLSQHCNPEKELMTHKSQESPLRSLIYPLVQVTLGVIRLIPTAQFFPLRFYLIRALIRLSQGTGVFIPIFPLLSEILTSTAFTKQPKRSPLPALEFEYHIKVGSQYLGTKVYQEGLQSQFIELTSEYLVLYCKSIAFPELVTPVVLTLRRYAKKSKSGKFNKQIQQLVEKLNANASYITSKRSNVEYGPSNKAEVQAFLKEEDWKSTPLGQYVSVHRKARENQAKLLKQAVADEKEAAAKNKAAANSTDGMMFGSDEE